MSIDPSTLVPSTPPSWRNMLTVPLAIPAWAGATLFMAAAVAGAISEPKPTPRTTSATVRFVQPSCGWTRSSSNDPSAVMISPAVSMTLKPMRGNNRGAIALMAT